MRVMDDERVYKALADVHRRQLLDRLFEQDGLTLTQMCEGMPMTRFGCMKHLQVLEDADLITTRKVGREKFHYLNPMPIQLMYERWVSKFAGPWAQAISGLKAMMEDKDMSAKPAHVFHTFIRTTPERLWQALTDGTMTQLYYFGTRIQSTFEAGALYQYLTPQNTAMIDGKIIESDPPRRLVTTFRPLWLEDAAAYGESIVTFEIEAEGPVCRLTVTHSGLDEALPAVSGMVLGWARILSGLKSLLETGEALPVAI